MTTLRREEAARDLLLAALCAREEGVDLAELARVVRVWGRAEAGEEGVSLFDLLRVERVLSARQLRRLRLVVDSTLGHDPAGAGAGAGARLDATSQPTVAYHGPSGDSASGSGSIAAAPPGAPAGSARFQPIRLHARGGLGEVWLANDRELNRPVALKTLPESRMGDPALRARFLREAEITGSLEHPGIVPVYSLLSGAGRPSYAMRMIEGGTLRQAIDQHDRQSDATGDRLGHTLAFRRLLRSVIDACHTMAYAHSRGVIHRDLKPENIMLGPFGQTLVVDWGLARRVGDVEPASASDRPEPDLAAADSAMTQPGSVLGTPRYMSPEQAAGQAERVGPASDVYSLGAILYCVLTSADPFPAGDVATVLERVRRGIFPAPRRVRKSVDPELEAICLRAMALDPAERTASALELAGELESWLASVRYRREQNQTLGAVRTSEARLALERANQAFAAGSTDEGLLWLTRAIENAPAAPSDLDRVARLNLAAWHASAPALERRLRHGVNGSVQTIAFDRGGRALATGSDDQSARLWDLASGAPLLEPLAHPGSVRSAAFHPSEPVLATLAADGHVRLWDTHTGRPLPHADPLPCAFPTQGTLQFDPSGRHLAAGPNGTSAPLNVWPGVLHQPGREPDTPPDALYWSFSPCGQWLAWAAANGSFHIRPVDGGPPSPAAFALDRPAAWFAWDNPSDHVWILTESGSLALWGRERGERVQEVGASGPVARVAVCPLGRLIALVTGRPRGRSRGRGASSVRLWSAGSGGPIGERMDHPAPVDCLAFGRDGALLATGAQDGLVRLWCGRTGLPVGPALEHGPPVAELLFRPDGLRLISRGGDPLVRYWRVPEPVAAAPERLSCWARITTNLEFDPAGSIRPLDSAAAWDLRRRLDALGGPPFRS